MNCCCLSFKKQYNPPRFPLSLILQQFYFLEKGAKFATHQIFLKADKNTRGIFFCRELTGSWFKIVIIDRNFPNISDANFVRISNWTSGCIYVREGMALNRNYVLC